MVIELQQLFGASSWVQADKLVKLKSWQQMGLEWATLVESLR
jgi:hypothetical protein